MRSMRPRLVAVTLLGGLTTLGLGLSAGPASAAVNDCLGYVGNAPSGSLQMTGTPAAGSVVPAGSTIDLQASWNDQDFDETDRFFVCGSVDGVFNAAMSSQLQGVDNDGTLTAASSLPTSVPVGSDVCIVGVIKGRLADQTQGNMVSETLCYTSAAVTTTTTMAPTTTTTAAAPRTAEPTVDPGTTEAGAPSAPAVEAAPVVEGDVAVAPAPLPELPRTGNGIDLLAGVGGITLALGGLTRFLGRRRPAEG